MSGQSTAPPEQRGRLIVLDREIVQRVLGSLPAAVIRSLRAELQTNEEAADGEAPPEEAPPGEQLPLDRHLRALMADCDDPDSPTFFSSARRPPKPPAPEQSPQ
jgi:hypothetical protein